MTKWNNVINMSEGSWLQLFAAIAAGPVISHKNLQALPFRELTTHSQTTHAGGVFPRRDRQNRLTKYSAKKKGKHGACLCLPHTKDYITEWQTRATPCPGLAILLNAP